MNTLILGLLAETAIHVGGSQGAGVVDLPVAREGGTDYPFIPGSGLKGALRDTALTTLDEAKCDELCGKPDRAGALLIGDARLLLLPVRSLTGTYRWITCPHLLERYRRDRRRAGHPVEGALPPSPSSGGAFGSKSGKILLEEREFTLAETNLTSLVESIGAIVPDEGAKSRLTERIVILQDDDFAWFARYGLPVQARNVLEAGTKKSTNLWFEEALPMDTVMYTMIGARDDTALEEFKRFVAEAMSYLQVGGNETVGQGWFSVASLAAEEPVG